MDFYLPFKQDYTVEGFSTVTYKGNESTMYVGGTGFKPDLVWFKQRDGTRNHTLIDLVRGGTKQLFSNSTGTEETYATAITSFDTDGFTIGSQYNINEDNKSMVAWNWDMGADTPTGFGCVTYKGNGGTQDISGFGFSPDLVWLKNRGVARNHQLYDTIRGSAESLMSNGTDAEFDRGTTGLTSFNPDGFSVGNHNTHNENTAEFVAWGWDMGSTTATNTSGNSSSQVRANTTYGQSIVSWTMPSSGSTTVGHGLNSTPELIIQKRRDGTSNWSVYTATTGKDKKLLLHDTAASANSGDWDNTAPTSNLFTSWLVNGTADMVAYCFHSVSGYSKFGSYTGSGGSGNAQTLGFRPAFVMIKKTSGTDDWAIIDSTRSPLNPVDKALRGNASNAEDDLSSNYQIDFTDTGFTFNNYGYNDSGATYIYMAFAGGMDSISDYNTDGSIDSRVKANTTYGQSVVSYTGASGAQTIGHGLSSAPEMIIAKNRSSAQEWLVFHHQMATSNSEQKYLRLDSTQALGTNTFWNNTAPTSSVFSVGDSQPINSGHGNDYVAYLWHSVSGYSSIGRYTGNGSATGPSVTTGFRPAWIMIKPSTVADHWNVYDTTRDPQNPINHLLFPNRTNAEGTGQDIEISDTGFQIKTDNTGSNQNGEYYIYMAFADKREYAYWLDQSGNNNDWTSNNLTESDISVDSPTNNFATMNPLGSPAQSSVITYSEGNLKTAHSGTNLNSSSVATMQLPPSGKYYWEVLVTAGGDNYVGVGHNWVEKQNNNDWIFAQGGWSYRYNGQKYSDGTANSYGDAFVANDLIGCAVDVDNSKIYFSKNGVWQNSSNPATSTNPAYTNVTGDNLTIHTAEGSSAAAGFIANFGQDSSFAGNKTAQGNQDGNDIGDFYYTPPTGFLALCTSNLPDATVTPSEHFNTVLWTGDGTDDRSITGVGFQSDFTWVKGRNAAEWHNVYDAVRGANKAIYPNSTYQEESLSDTFESFDSDGFTVGYNSSYSSVFTNKSSTNYVAWNWKANGSGSSNTNGSITSTVSANVDAGFSILTYTGNATSGATVGHGLSKTPEFIIIKKRSASALWAVYNKSDGNTKVSHLDLNAASYTSAGIWNNTTPDASVFTLGNNALINGTSTTYVAYCFHSVEGYSKVGSYTGNGNADGTFVYTGFRPAFVMMKDVVNANSWVIIDSERDTYNQSLKRLYADSSEAEYTATDDTIIDIVSNGFKHRYAGGNANQSNDEVIYIAFAETPFKYSNAR
jgi:hypothetical protein